MSWGQGAADLAKTIAEYHKELVTTSVRFEDLRRQMVETLAEFKVSLERLSDRVGAIEREHIAAQCDLKAKIDAGSERLTMISERAIHAAAFEATKQATRERLAGQTIGE